MLDKVSVPQRRRNTSLAVFFFFFFLFITNQSSPIFPVPVHQLLDWLLTRPYPVTLLPLGPRLARDNSASMLPWISQAVKIGDWQQLEEITMFE